MLLVDQKATAVAPSPVFLTRAEFKEIYPHRLSGRINYVFKYNRPKEVNDGEAKILIKKYSHIIEWEEKVKMGKTERHEELDKLKYQELKTIGAKVGLVFKELAVKKPILINKIVDKEIGIAQIEEKLKGDKGINK